jgi:transcriptional regulator with XRE-family HTH domain
MEADWFAGRLRELREAAGLTQGTLAERAGMNKFGVAKLEQGVTRPSWETVVALCKALGVGCDAFLKEPAAGPSGTIGRPHKVEAPVPPVAATAPKKQGRPHKAEQASLDAAERASQANDFTPPVALPRVPHAEAERGLRQ